MTDIELLAKLAANVMFKQASPDRQQEKRQERKRLGPLEFAYVADAVGAQAVQNAARKIQGMAQDPANPYTGSVDRLLMNSSKLVENVGERIQRGSSRMAQNPTWRLLSMIDPTASDKREGIVGLLSGFGGKQEDIEEAKRRTSEAYAKFLKKHQDKVDPNAKITTRETPWHIGQQANLANFDSDIAGHRYMRNERPLHYWLNPFNRSGPISETSDRFLRRLVAAHARPDSTAGRAGAMAGGLLTLGAYPLLTGGEHAQQKLRAAAVKNKIYAPEAMPDEKSAFAADYSYLSKIAQDSNIVLLGKIAAVRDKMAQASGAWTRSEGQSESGGLNEKGRASLKAQGHDIKPPVTEDNPKGERAGRKSSFCARMSGMKKKLTSSETANDPDSRINKALRKWNC